MASFHLFQTPTIWQHAWRASRSIIARESYLLVLPFIVMEVARLLQEHCLLECRIFWANHLSHVTTGSQGHIGFVKASQKLLHLATRPDIFVNTYWLLKQRSLVSDIKKWSCVEIHIVTQNHKLVCLGRDNLTFALHMFITHRLTDFSVLWLMQSWWNNLSISITPSQIQMLNFSLLLQGADPAVAAVLDKWLTRQQAALGGTQIQI